MNSGKYDAMPAPKAHVGDMICNWIEKYEIARNKSVLLMLTCFETIQCDPSRQRKKTSTNYVTKIVFMLIKRLD